MEQARGRPELALRTVSTNSYERRRPDGPLSLAAAVAATSYGADSDEDDVDSSLPFPTPLPRSDFLTAGGFDPPAYLSSVVANRYQTLEDLRSELRTRVQELNAELVNLVNRHQTEFVGLGSSLHGGEEKVEEVRLGVLSFEREIGEVTAYVEDREKAFQSLLGVRQDCRNAIETGRHCLAFNESLKLLERRLRVRVDTESFEESEDSFDDEDAEGVSMARLHGRVSDLLWLKRTKGEHPFIKALAPRVSACEKALLADLGSCMRRTKGSKGELTEILRMYAQLDASKEATRQLKQGQRSS